MCSVNGFIPGRRAGGARFAAKTRKAYVIGYFLTIDNYPPRIDRNAERLRLLRLCRNTPSRPAAFAGANPANAAGLPRYCPAGQYARLCAAFGMRRYAAPCALCSPCLACLKQAGGRCEHTRAFRFSSPALPLIPRFQPNSATFAIPPDRSANMQSERKRIFLIFYLTRAALPAKSRLVPDELKSSEGNTECGTLAQLVEQQTFNLFVDSSTLSCLTCVLVV